MGWVGWMEGRGRGEIEALREIGYRRGRGGGADPPTHPPTYTHLPYPPNPQRAGRWGACRPLCMAEEEEEEEEEVVRRVFI